MKGRLPIAILCLLAFSLLLPAQAEADGFTVPAGFDDELAVGGVGFPTSIAWPPASEGGDLLITSQEGTLYSWDGSGPADVILDLQNTICFNSGGEMGLLGLAVDPDFADNGFLYLYYTNKKNDQGACSAGNRANRVSRFFMAANGTIDEQTEQALIDNIAARGGNHNGGDLQFGRDGFLYVSVGDGGEDLRTGEVQDNNGNARRLDLLNGKILRITTAGDPAPRNPFTGTDSAACGLTGKVPEGSARVSVEKKQNKRARKRKRRKKRHNQPSGIACREIFATGLRNPYRFAFDPDDDSGAQRFFINDVGGGAWEEIDEGAAGADYGWNIREGPCRVGSTSQCDPDNRFVEPIFAYTHGDNCRTITGGAFVPDEAGWPVGFSDVYFYTYFKCGDLFALRNEAPGGDLEPFGTGPDFGPTHLAFGPDDALYYTTFNDGGEVRRIVPS